MSRNLHKITFCLMALTALAAADDSQTSGHPQQKGWDLKISDPDREGKFLNVPIFYGEWVPITKAKATIDSVAASLDSSSRREDGIPDLPEPDLKSLIISPEAPAPKSSAELHDEVLDRIDETPQITYFEEKPHQHHQHQHPIPHFRRPAVGPEPNPYHKQQQQHGQHHFGGGHSRWPHRRQDKLRGNRRNQRKLPPPNSAQSSGLVNSLSSFFGGGSNPAPTTGRPQTAQTGGFNFGQVFNIPQFLGSKTPPPHNDYQQRPGYISDEPAETILYHTPVIKTVDAPDLTKAGPPVIELGGVQEHRFDVGGIDGGEIIVGQRRPELGGDGHDHLSGFYSVDFDDFSTGDNFQKKPHDGKISFEKSPTQLSVHVSGLTSGDGNTVDMRQLAKLFKEGQMDGENHKAFISRPEEPAPEGFNKVTLPFLDPSQADAHKDALPAVFIAPVGYKVPPGYKGHPLPYDPASLDHLNQKVAVVHSTNNDLDASQKIKNPFLSNRIKKTSTTTAPNVSPDQPQDEHGQEGVEDERNKQIVDPSTVLLNKLKLARNRPNLTNFYNKTRIEAKFQQQTPPVVIEEELVGEPTKKRKRVLTKVVRKPYNPDTTTPASATVTHEFKTTVVRIASPSSEDELVEFVTRPVVIQPEQSSEDTTETPSPTTVSEGRQDEAEPDLTTVLPEVEVQPEATSERVETIVEHVVTSTSVERDPIVVVVDEVDEPAVAITTTTTEAVFSYEPTPPNHENRLERFRLKNRKQANHKNFASFPALDIEPEEEVSSSLATSEPTTSDRPYGLLRNRLNLRKYGFNTNPNGNNNNPFESNAAANIFGQRIRARKRPPPPYNEDHEEEEDASAATSETSTKKSKADQYKKKFRPFFDQLYDQLTGNDQQPEQQQQPEEHVEGGEEFEEGDPIRGWARRSTTTPNPFTINAEIYEVHPDSRERITTTKSTTTTTTAAPTTTTSETEEPVDYEANQRVDDQPEDDITYVDTNNPPPLEYVELKLKNFDATEIPVVQPDAVFEPSQEAQDLESEAVGDHWSAIAVPHENIAVAQETIPSLFDAAQAQSHEPLLDQQPPEVEQQQFIHFQPVRQEGEVVDRLHSYEKNIQPQQHWLHDLQTGDEQVPIVNEHTQQHLHVNEDDFIPFQPEVTRPAYVDIQRYREDAQALSVVPSTETVDETTETEVEDDSATTETTIFVTRPTVTTTVESDTQSTLQVEEEVKVTTIPPLEAAVVDVDPQPEVNADQHPVEEVEEAQASTTQDYFEVTTFRPKVTGGFLEKFNLGNILGYILPAATTTTTVETPTTTPADAATADLADEESTTVVPTISDEEEEKSTEVPQLVEDSEQHQEVPEAVAVEDHQTVAEAAVTNDVEAITEEVHVELETTDKEETEVEIQPDVAVVADQATEEAEITTTEPEVAEVPEVVRNGRPKAIAQPEAEVNQAEVKVANISKSVYGAIKREEYLKNFVNSRKYHKFTEAGNQHGVIITPPASEEHPAAEDPASLPSFVPTVLPITSDKEEVSEWETSGVTIKKKRRKNNPLLDKLSSSRKTLKDSLLAKSSASASSTTTTTTTSTTSSERISAPEYPRGSDTKVFKQWQGGSLSQAEFEQKVLGVSTATEVSVKSVICVRGRCYNGGENVPSFFGH